MLSKNQGALKNCLQSEFDNTKIKHEIEQQKYPLANLSHPVHQEVRRVSFPVSACDAKLLLLLFVTKTIISSPTAGDAAANVWNERGVG